MQGYKYHPLCKVCNARDVRGRSLREEIDAMIAQGKKNVECIQFLSQYGINVTQRNFSRHITKHSPFARSAKITQSSTAIKLKHQYEAEYADTQEVIKKIIAMGDTMIDAWWQGIEDHPKMPVSEKLFTEALKEEGRRAPRNEISMELEMMEQEMFEKLKNQQKDNG